MKLIVGLGNPGLAYAGSRHNVGFMVVRQLAKELKSALKKEKGCPWLSAKAKFEGVEVILALPMTFMNLSGSALSGMLKKYNLDLGGVLIVCDDMDIEFGRLKIRSSGSSGGQRGLKSIIDSLGAKDFHRLRIGIGRPPQGMDAADYVLSSFSRSEKVQIKEITDKAVECCSMWVTGGITETMNVFNSKE